MSSTRSNKFALEMKQIYKKYSHKTVVEDVSLSIKPGEVFGLLGPNGAGKTTIIRMLVGLVQPSSGEIHLMGCDLKRNYEEAIQHVGAIVETPDFYGFLTGYQNLMQCKRAKKGVSHEDIKRAVQFVNLEERIHDKVSSYSLGMKQRLGIAQAILHQPQLLILDEPTNGLDPLGMRELRSIVQRLAKEMNIAVFISSHILSEVQEICDNVGFIKNGKLLFVRDMKSIEMEQSKFRIVVSDGQMTQQIFEQLGWIFDVGDTLNSFIISGSSDTNKLVKELALSEVGILRFEPVLNTLEDVFMETMKEDDIHDRVNYK
ncbi:ABC transporter ATP-binding protein [Shimazuella sp. AN120528]|uniref:ABC transporter ATP-binding protein n=1 Tax=Shimazuella soli TaxID=1892854 RepID=UPI001F107575|nr:ABC transporter ATP-binding protein [Shimazuella soli]MCH5585143.1 ABC transporter ATP-binding protein [Shimazuella soli]